MKPRLSWPQENTSPERLLKTTLKGRRFLIKSMKTPAWVVKSVYPKENYTLLLTFADGSKKVYNARPLLDKSIYAPLKNLSFFLKAKTEYDTVVWNDELDIVPEHLYEYSTLT